ncbi:PIN domain-containing protein [Phyllobacterium zundukense]|uniref:PIN domain-containing protein n=1 Tax=Phyllobacterium zundukense TaxID=1867719 RepID=UPI000D529104|nr:PIN domain-containing protein [Phyllobacterium zundukense]
MARLRRLNLKDLDIDGDRAILSIALKHNLSAYDAAYLALAIDQSLPLATNDRKLAAAARAEAVKILGPLNNAL